MNTSPFPLAHCRPGAVFPSFNNVNQVDFGGGLRAGVLAETVTWFLKSNPADTIECDMRFSNAVSWYTGTDPSSTQIDWQSVATHEMGHCLGLSHQGGITPTPVMAPTFALGETRRVLTADDIAGRNVIYGGPGGPAALRIFVAGFYQDVLGRQPDPQGLNSRAGISRPIATRRASIRSAWPSSDDSQEFRTVRPLTLNGLVTSLYRTFLDRYPDPAGRGEWVQHFRHQRVVVSNEGFISSAEFKNLLPDRTDRVAVAAVITRFYEADPGATAESRGSRGWVNYVVTTGDLEGVAVEFIHPRIRGPSPYLPDM